LIAPRYRNPKRYKYLLVQKVLTTPTAQAEYISGSNAYNLTHRRNTMTDLQTKAAKLWPNQPAYQTQWIKAIQTLRANKGWVLEGAKVNWRAGK
jgi:hypothetical protein